MNNYTDKEKKIIKQCHEGPYYKVVTEITNNEFNDLVDKLIKDDDVLELITLVSIYWDYNRNKIIDYFINKGDADLLLNLLDYCNDFQTSNNELDQRYIVDKLLDKNDKELIKNILESNNTYFLTDIKEKEKLINSIYYDTQNK